MDPRTPVAIIGVGGLIFFWFLFRELLKEGEANSNARWLFLLKKR
jgi:hypothetical protein